MLNVPSQHEKTKALQAVIKGFFPPWLFYHQISQKCCWKVILDLTWINLYSPEIHIGYFMKYSKIRSPRIGTAADIKTHFGVKSETWEEVLISEHWLKLIISYSQRTCIAQEEEALKKYLQVSVSLHCLQLWLWMNLWFAVYHLGKCRMPEVVTKHYVVKHVRFWL